ncbi:MAG: sigma-54-dependent transcriptional regulator [Alphaproteobacteria bacterium]
MALEILIVDDEDDIRFLTSGILEDEGYETREAASDKAALDAISLRQPHLVLLDIWLEGSAMDGLGILDAIKKDNPELPVLMMSGHGNIETAVNAIKRGAYDFIEKPFKSNRLLLLVDRALENARLKRENKELKRQSSITSELVGDSVKTRRLKSLIQKIAPTNSRILIKGPAGSGKEIVARAIHKASLNAEGPFIVANCANMAADSLEESLFGVEGDNNNPAKIGLLEQAHRGTLLLDEIGDMPMETQTKITRLLQDQTFYRVGGKKEVSVNVRIMASTTQDLEVKIQDATFREDLYYRLNVVPVEVDALKDRRDDIMDLADYFLVNITESISSSMQEFSEDAKTILQSWDWPGNVRELKNLIERVVIMASDSKSEEIDADMLPEEIKNSDRIRSVGETYQELITKPLREAREEFERRYIETQLIRFNNHISKTASFIGMERSAFHRKIKMLGLSTEGKVDENEDDE